MHFTLAAALALANSAMAAVGVTATPGFNAVFTPESGQSVPAGEPFVVKWSNPEPYANNLIYIQLLGGNSPETLIPVDPKLDGKVINNNATQYTWNVSPSLGDDKVYGLRFVLVDDEQIVQYSQPFSISKAAGPDTSKIVTTSTQLPDNSTTTASETPATLTAKESAASDSTSASEESSATESSSESSSESTTSTPFPTSETTSAMSSPSNKIIPSIATPGTKPTQSPLTGGASRVAGSVAVIGGLVAVALAF